MWILAKKIEQIWEMTINTNWVIYAIILPAKTVKTVWKNEISALLIKTLHTLKDDEYLQNIKLV